jgi:hypothetical protein
MRPGLYKDFLSASESEFLSLMVRLKNRDPDFKIGTKQATSKIEVASMNYRNVHRDSLAMN